VISSAAVIAVSKLAKAFGAQTLFSDVSLQLNPGARYGLVGANGSGKTTLLNIIIGSEEPSEGAVSSPRRLRIGVLSQDHFRFEELAIIDVVMMGHHELWQALQEKEEVLARSEESFDGERYAELEDIIVSNDGYAFEARAGEILEGLGIPTEVHRETLSTLSGGFKLRVLLAQVLASDPQCLLLDEPTNHLDILSIRWLEKFLVDYTGCAVVISHDHRFLDNVSSHILDVDYETITLYTGNYSAFLEAKRSDRERRQAEIARREKQIAGHQATIDRFRSKATKARQAQSMIKQMERVVIERLAPTSRRYPTFRFSQCRPSGKKALETEGVGKSFGDNRVLHDVSLHVRRGDRLAVIGPNGIGKSTLLKIIAGRLEADQGHVEWGHETYPGYFAQDYRDHFGGGTQTVQDWLWDVCPGDTIGVVRNRLAQVLFSGEEVEKKVAHVSGGEGARLIFARLPVEQPNVLVLVEPTNHLDLEAIEALVKGLNAFEGTLIFVSHDRWFVSRLANRILEISPSGLKDYRGSYEEYVDSCGDDHLDTEATLLRMRRGRRKERQRQGDRRRHEGNERQRQRRVRELETRRDEITAAIEDAEQRIAAIDAEFCTPGFFEKTGDAEVRRLQEKQRRLRTGNEDLMSEWDRIETELEGS